MDETIETRLRLLEERTENLKTQEARSNSHLISEREVRREQGFRIDRLEKVIEALEKILRNGGQGLMFKVDRLEQVNVGNKNRLAIFFSIAALALEIIDLVKTYIIK